MAFKLEIDTHEVAEYSKKLAQLHRSAFPNAVRNTLNSAAFDVKKNTLPKVSGHKFQNRTPNFFKAFSRVEMAKGFDLKTMASVVGMMEQGLKGSNNYAVKDLEQQETGGRIGGKSFIPLNSARVGRSNKRNVQPKNRISNIRGLVSVSDAKGSGKGQRFIKSVVHAGAGGYVLTERGYVLRVDSLRRIKNRWRFKLTALYSYRNNRSVTVRKTQFMEHSARISAKKMPIFYKFEANKQFKKYLK